MDKFFELYRKEFGKLKSTQVKPLENLVIRLLDDHRLTIPQKAYVIATVKHETAHTYKAINEYGKGRGRKYGRRDPETGHTYYGRGYVQLTWKRNYDKMGKQLGVDLVNNPDLALDPKIAYEVLVIGMIHGYFTGKALKHYINDKKTDFRQARRIVNGMDKATLISNYAKKFLKIFESIGEIVEAEPEKVKNEEPVREKSPVMDKKHIPTVKDYSWGEILVLLLKKLYNLLKGKGGKQ